MQRKDFKVIIIGGGLGGLCLAQGLKKSGILFEVFERNKDNDSWLEGYRINISSVGSKALYECLPQNLWDAFLAGVGDPKKGLGFMTEKLEELIFVDEDMIVGYTNDPDKQQYAIGRKMLRYILQSGIESEIRYDKNFVYYEQMNNGKVKVFFEDGGSVTGDLLVGADGANSKVRQQLLPHALRSTTDAVAVAGKTMLTNETRKWMPAAITSRMNVIMPLRKYFFFNAAFDHSVKNTVSRDKIETAAFNAGLDPEKFFDSNENYILWAFIANKNEFKQELENPGVDVIGSVLNKIDNWHPDIRRLIQQGDQKSAALFQLKVMCPVKNWRPTNVTVLGDAIHNMPPVYGMGANMALHDAVILCKQMNKAFNGKCKLHEALQLFQNKMLRDGFKVLNASLTYTNQASSNRILQRWLSRVWFKVCSRITPLKKMSFGAKWGDMLKY